VNSDTLIFNSDIKLILLMVLGKNQNGTGKNGTVNNGLNEKLGKNSTPILNLPKTKPPAPPPTPCKPLHSKPQPQSKPKPFKSKPPT